MMPLWKVIETLEEMSCNPDIHNTEAIYCCLLFKRNAEFLQKFWTVTT